MTFPDGVLYTDETCRRGEVIVHPSWQTEPCPPMDAAKARPLVAKMGGAVDDRRQIRTEVKP
jgi:hypothetical protein